VPRGVSATPVAGWLTGEAAYRLGNVANILSLDGPAYNGGVTKTSGVDFSLSYTTTLPGGSTLSARALTTYVSKQLVQNNVDGVVTDALDAIGGAGLFLPNFQPAAKWSGTVSINWNIGNLNLTPNMRWVGNGTLSNTALSCATADFGDTASLCNWVANGYYAGPTQTPEQAEAQQRAYTILPEGVKNRVGTYFLFGLNGSYSLKNVPGVDGLQIWGQIDNLLDRDPPYNNTTTTAASFYQQLGRTYRLGVRLSF